MALSTCLLFPAIIFELYHACTIDSNNYQIYFLQDLSNGTNVSDDTLGTPCTCSCWLVLGSFNYESNSIKKRQGRKNESKVEFAK